MNTDIPFLDELRRELLDAGTRPEVASRRRWRTTGPIVAFAAFVLVLAVGAISWLTTRSGPATLDAAGTPVIDWDLRVDIVVPPDVDAFLADVDGLPGVVEIQYLPDPTVLRPRDRSIYQNGDAAASTTTVVDPEAPPTTGPPPARAVLLVRVDGPERASTVALAIDRLFIDGFASRAAATPPGDQISMVFSEDVGRWRARRLFERALEVSTVVAKDPPVVQPPLGPEPRFLPSALGEEVELRPLEPEDPAIEGIVEFVRRSGAVDLLRPGRSETGPDATLPIVHIGQLPVGRSRLVVYGTVDGQICTWRIAGSGFGGGGGCGVERTAQYGVAGAGTTGSVGVVEVLVPEETSVVVFVDGDGTRMWQRPVLGFGLFPAPLGDYFVTMTVEAYDVDGNLIGSWTTRF